MKRSPLRYLWKSEDIRKKLLMTLLFLVLYRVAATIPVPGIAREVIASLANSNSAAGSFLGLMDLLSGGTISNFSVLAMGVYPYITAQIILQLLVPIIPALERRMKENPREGQKWMEKWTIIATVPMALLSAFGQIGIFSQYAEGSIFTFTFGVFSATWAQSLAVILSMVAGTMFGIWLGQLISEYGIPNQGLSLIIFAGIVAKMPTNLFRIFADKVNWWWVLLVILALLVATIFAIVFVQQGRRNVPVLFPGRRIGNRMSMPVRSTLPLMVNMAGMIPMIFAQSLLVFPALIGGLLTRINVPWIQTAGSWMATTFNGQNGWYAVMYFIMVVLFTFFYTDVLFTQQNYGENLKKQGAQIPGVLRGAPTQKYLSKVQRRITLPGALFLGIIAVFPYIMGAVLPASVSSAGTFLVSAAGLLIVVGVVRDTFNIIETEMKLHGYDESIVKG